jgi:hypothetical protein
MSLRGISMICSPCGATDTVRIAVARSDDA